MVELDEVVSLVDELLDETEDRLVPPVAENVEDVEVALLLHQAQHAPNRLHVHGSPAEREDLVEERKRVPHAPVRLPGDQAQRVLGGIHGLFRQDRLQSADDVPHADAAEVEALAPRQDRSGGLLDLLRLRGREHEDHPGRRLLEDLQQRVPGFAGEHVSLVHDVDLAAPFGRGRVHGPLAEVARIVDAAVGGGVDLHHVQRGVPAPDPGAALAHPARLALGGAVGAVERHGEHARQRRLSDAPRTAEEVGVPDPIHRHRPAQRLRHVLLRRDVGEGPGPVFSR